MGYLFIHCFGGGFHRIDTGTDTLAMSERNHNDLAPEGGGSLPCLALSVNPIWVSYWYTILFFQTLRKKRLVPVVLLRNIRISYCQLTMKHRRMQTLVESFYWMNRLTMCQSVLKFVCPRVERVGVPLTAVWVMHR